MIVATKVLPGIDTKELLKGVVSDTTTIVLLQNGVEIEEPIQQAFPGTEIISGLCFICVNRVEPGVIDHQDYGHNEQTDGYADRNDEALNPRHETRASPAYPHRIG